MIVTYNLVIGALLMIGSEKLGVYAGYFMGSYREKAQRLTRIAVLAFGSSVVVLSVGVMIFGHLLRV